MAVQALPASSSPALSNTALLDYLELDSRPAFAVDINVRTRRYNVLLPIAYYNPALRAADGLLERVTGQQSVSSTRHQAFVDWVCDVAVASDPSRRGFAYVFEGYLWTTVTIGQYTIVSGTYTSLISSPSHKPPQHVPFEARPPMPLPALPSPPTSESPEPPRHGPFDFTFDPPPAVPISDHVKAFRSTDWAQTPLGPMSEWPSGLRCAVNVVLSNTQPTVLLWGDEATMIYNQASIQILGPLHPCLGQSARTSADLLPVVGHLLNHIGSTGIALAEHDLPMFIDRHGFLEETYWSYQFVPLLDDEGYVAGYVNTMFETTKHHLLERRVSSLVELGSQTSNARDFPSFWNLALKTLTLNEKDAPFALLYSVENPSGSDVYSSPENISLGSCTLKGSIGVEANHPIAPSTLSIHDSSYCLHSYLQETVKSREATVVNLEELGLPEYVLAGIDWKGFGEPCRMLIVCPIMPTTGDQIEGFLVLGTNPRRPFDDNYQRFVHVMMRLLGTSLASIVLIDEEVRQRETAIESATSVQEKLLAKLQQEERKFQKFAERADIAIFVVDPAGQYTYRNNRWYEIFEIAANAQGAADAWQVIAFPEDLVFCEGIFQQLVTKNEPVCFELKTKMLWNPPADLSEPEGEVIQHYTWILCSAYIELDSNGQLVEIVGSVTDISKQKWAEGIQKLRTDSALESKQHLEHFIDTTSHEMRNPLSAIMQCADGILSSYSFGDDHVPSPTTYFDLLEQTLDSAQTIAQCAQHMRHIVDDILTISKLDSGLLVITPVDTQPESIAKHAIKMFDSEARAAEINLSLMVEQSYRDLKIDWVSLDPTRVLQVSFRGNLSYSLC
jgi:signal transduction histidine kinase